MQTSPDRKWLIREDEKDAVAYLWSASRLEGPFPLRGHAGKVTDLAFSADGRRLMTGAEDGSLSLDAALGLAAQAVGRNLTEEEWAHYFPGTRYRPTFDTLPREE